MSKEEKHSVRVLEICNTLVNGGSVSKEALAAQYGVTEKTITRDLKDIEEFISRQDTQLMIELDKETNKYKINKIDSMRLSHDEAIAVFKILIDHRSLIAPEMHVVINKLLDLAVAEDSKKDIKSVINSELNAYISPRHNKPILPHLWKLYTAIREQRIIDIKYKRNSDNSIVYRTIKPVGIMCSEYYFYLVGFIESPEVEKEKAKKDPFPTIYRIDRIEEFEYSDLTFEQDYKKQFSEGEFKKRIQFMTGGKPMLVRFKYKGSSLEAVLDKIPTAKYTKNNDNTYDIRAEVFGEGIYKWLKANEDDIENFKAKEIPTK